MARAKITYKFKKGDKVRCKPGYTTNEHYDEGDMCAGGGYESHKEFILKSFDSTTGIVWPEDGGSGVYAHAVEYAGYNCYNIY